MYAVFKTGGKQYRGKIGDRLHIEKIDVTEGNIFNFEQVLLIGEGTEIKVGSPFLEDVKVSAKVLVQGRGKKIKVVKFKRRTNYRRTKGHRQHYTEIEIISILDESKTKLSIKDPEIKVAKKKATKKKATKKKATKKKVTKKKVAKKVTTKKEGKK
tara:strand:- start:174 stop:641 length:468 start_codon:yes stop_codon:yes gene_type:complete